MIAASATFLPMGPAVSWSAVMGMMPHRLMRPMVGLMAASMFRLDGPMIEPPVSVPTFPAQKLAAVPVPDEEPPVFSTPRPSFWPGRGSRRGS